VPTTCTPSFPKKSDQGSGACQPALRHYTSADLEAVKAAGEKLRIKVLGLASIAPDVTPALALAAIELITVLGALHASKEIKSALADRIG
jgi:hypothetical protein